LSIFQPRLGQERYSDARNRNRLDPERERQPELDWYMERYGTWRDLYSGEALEETISISEDLSREKEHETYRWPVRFNLVRSFCLLYAGMLWGRGTTGKDPSKLFDVRIGSKVPGKSGPESTKQADRYKDILDYFWGHNFKVLRPNGTIQQWAGGCVIKVAWNPFSPTSVWGIQLQTVQPEHFYPVWNPLSVEELIAVKVKFSVSKIVAREQYGLTDTELDEYVANDKVTVEEHWDRFKYYVVLGKGKNGVDDLGVVGRIRNHEGRVIETMDGKNPYLNPRTGIGIIPFVYVPRLRDGTYFGDSLAHSLDGVQQELNKTLADYGDALTRGSHPPFGISDYRGPGSKDKERSGVIMLPRHGALNMGVTPATRQQSKVHEFPAPTIPPETGEFTDRLLTLSEVTAGLTPAARGVVSANKSGVAMAMELLPTTTTIDWERSHWTEAIGGFQGINEIASVIWLNKAGEFPGLPSIEPGMLVLPQHLDYRPVVPRDHAEVIDEVVRLATARAVSPKEWLRRLGDIPDMNEELVNLITYLTWMARIEAAVAGRAITVSQPTNPEEPARALPEVAGQTEKPKAKQPAKQPEGQKTTKE